MRVRAQSRSASLLTVSVGRVLERLAHARVPRVGPHRAAVDPNRLAEARARRHLDLLMTTCCCNSSSSFIGRFTTHSALAFDQSKSITAQPTVLAGSVKPARGFGRNDCSARGVRGQRQQSPRRRRNSSHADAVRPTTHSMARPTAPRSDASLRAAHALACVPNGYPRSADASHDAPARSLARSRAPPRAPHRALAAVVAGHDDGAVVQLVVGGLVRHLRARDAQQSGGDDNGFALHLSCEQIQEG